MFFPLSKIFWILFTPLTLIGLLLISGVILLWFKRDVWGRRLVSLGLGLFLILGFLPVGPNLMVYLESRYQAPNPLPDKVTGIVVLGGMIEGKISKAHDQVTLNDNTERLTEMIRLSRLYPKARIIFTGGPGFLGAASTTESEIVERLLKELDISSSRFVFENRARNTYENMLYSRELAHPQAGENWLLVTSGFHMPRSMAIFTAGGWKMTPYPAGYIEEGAYIWRPSLDLLGNFYKLQVASREIVGIIAYALTGKL